MLSGLICQFFGENHSASGEGMEELKTSLFSKSYVTSQGDSEKNICGHSGKGMMKQVPQI